MFNEYQLVFQSEKGYSLKTMLKRMAFLKLPKAQALNKLTERKYSYFQLIPSPIGDVDEEKAQKVIRVYIPIDRLRLKWLDDVWFYPFVFYLSFEVVETVMLEPVGALGGQSIIGYYIQFFPQFASATLGMMDSNVRNSITVWMPLACIVELIPIIMAYIPSKYILSWMPSWLWNLSFGFYLKS